MSRFVDEQFFGGFDHFEGERFFTKTQVFGWDETIQEDVNAWPIVLVAKAMEEREDVPSRTE